MNYLIELVATPIVYLLGVIHTNTLEAALVTITTLTGLALYAIFKD